MAPVLQLLWPQAIEEGTVPENIKGLLGDYAEVGEIGSRHYLQIATNTKKKGCLFYAAGDNGWWLTDGGKPNAGTRVLFGACSESKAQGEIPYAGWQLPGFFGMKECPVVASFKEGGALHDISQSGASFFDGMKVKSAQRLEDVKAFWKKVQTERIVAAKDMATQGGSAAATAAKDAAKEAHAQCSACLAHPDTAACVEGSVEVVRNTTITCGMFCMQGVIKCLESLHEGTAEQKDSSETSAPKASTVPAPTAA